MRGSFVTLVGLWCALVASPGGQSRPVVTAPRSSAAPASPSFDGPAIRVLLEAYWDGRLDVVNRSFQSGQEVATMLPKARIFSETGAARGWEEAFLVLIADLADAAIRLPDPSPETAIGLVGVGFEQIARKRTKDEPNLHDALVLRWHQTAIGILEGAAAWAQVDRHVTRIERRSETGLPARFWLARGTARATVAGPEAPAATVEGQADAPAADAAPVTGRQADALEDAILAFDRAARDPDVRAEASARAAAAFLRLGRARDARRRLDLAGDPAGDLALAAWLQDLAAQAARALDEPAAAALALEQARRLDPGRASAATLAAADYRFVPAWLDGLRRDLSSAMSTTDGSPLRPPLAVLLDRYDDGDYEFLARAMRESESLGAFGEELRVAVPAWVEDGGLLQVAHREQVAAAVALEAAYSRGVAEGPAAQVLVEWACERLRKQLQPDEAERLWMWGASALFEGLVAGAALEVHATHALQRFPDDPALIMARAVAAELRTTPDDRAGRRMTETRTSLVKLALTRFEQAAADGPYRAEALLRIGRNRLRQAKPADAIPPLTAALASTTDPFVVYLAQLFLGRAHERLDQPEQAVTAYEAAVRAAPGAQTAELALAGALARAGRRAEAATQASASLGRAEGGADPWLAYGQADLRRWPDILTKLREALR